MFEKRVIVEISPSRLAAAVWCRGRVIASGAERHDAARFRDDWAGAIASLRPLLKGMVQTLGAAGAPATVVYSSPSAVCGVFSCPVSAGRAAWDRAARLAIAEAASFPIAENPVDCVRLAADAPATPGTSEAPAHAHTLGVADSDDALDALADLVASAGLSPVDFIPSGAFALASAVVCALAPGPAGPATIVLNLDEHASVLAIAARGRLKLVRQLGFGTELLAEGLARALSSDPARAGAARGQARTILGTIGIPAKDQVVDASRGVTGAAVLPVLQPLLQRLLIEAKQSLRFGLTEDQRGSPRLVVVGPGAGVPGLAKLVASQTGATLHAGNESTGPDAPRQARRPGVALAPRALRMKQHARAAARGLWTGGVAAAVLVAYLAVSARSDLVRARSRLASDRAALEQTAAVRAMIADLGAARLGLADARRRIDAAFVGGTDWGAVLVALADQTPDTISLGTVELTMDRERPICRLRGQARAPAGTDPSATVRAYLDRLTRAPIVRTCSLGSTQRVGDPHDPRQTFILTLNLVELSPALSLADGGTP